MIGRSQTLQCQFGNISGPEGIKQKLLEMFYYNVDLQIIGKMWCVLDRTFLVGPYDDLPNWIKAISDLDWDPMISTLLLQQRLVSWVFPGW